MQTLKICESKLNIQEKLRLLDSGFKLESDSNEVSITVPDGWRYDELMGEPLMGIFYDDRNNYRGCFYYDHVFFRCRYAIVIVPIEQDETNSDSDRLMLVDRRENKIVFDFGTLCFVSEYTSELLLIARSKIRKIYPEYEDPCSYWDRD